MSRKFYIMNAVGQQIQLQDGDIFFSAPSGWGFSEDISYEPVGGFFLETKRTIGQVAKAGTLVFLPGGAYETYRDFADWIFAANGLTLAYNPDGAEWYYIDIDITRMDKGELSRTGWLEIPVTFTPKTPIYSVAPRVMAITGTQASNVKRYSYTYDCSYAATVRVGAIEFIADAQMPCDLDITIPGEISSPVLTATDSGGNIIGKLDLSTYTVPDGSTLHFSTRTGNAGVWSETDGMSTDLSEYIELTSGTPVFFKVPQNQEITLMLTADDLTGITAYISLYQYFRTV